MSITLAQLRLQARQRADMESSNFVKDNELTNYINNSIAELHDLLCEAFESEYNVQVTAAQTITSGQDSYDLPTDFYELKGVDIRLSNQTWINVDKFNFNRRNLVQDSFIWGAENLCYVQYRIVGNQLIFKPAPTGSAEYRLWYVPVATRLVDDADELDDLNAYSEYVIVDAAIKMLQKEESDVAVLMAQKEALRKRIVDKASTRDAGQADVISDANIDWDDFVWRRGV